MGLDCSHDCWHGSYGSFSTWRNRLAYVSGWAGNGGGDFDLEAEGWHDVDYVIPDDRIPDQGPIPDEVVTVDSETFVVKWSEHYANGVYLGFWENDPDDVLDVLFLHSDCEGKIPHRFTLPLAVRLGEIAKLFPDEDPRTHGWHTRDRTLQFATGLLKAHARGEDVDFR